MEILLILAMVVVAIGFKLYVPPLMIRRAVRPVIERFVRLDALSEADAKSVHELGLGPRGLAERMVSLRDYKPKALDALISAAIVQRTDDGRVFLSEEKLLETGLLDKWPALGRRLEALKKE
jgi:hypothetical protein